MISIAKPEATISHPPPTPLHLHVGCRRQTLPILREISLSLSLPTPVRSPVQSEAKAPEVRGAVPLTAHRVVELQDPRSAGSRETSTGRIPASRSGHHHRRPVAVAAVAEAVEEEDYERGGTGFRATMDAVQGIVSWGKSVVQVPTELQEELDHLQVKLPSARSLISRSEWAMFRNKNLEGLVVQLKYATYDAEDLLR